MCARPGTGHRPPGIGTTTDMKGTNQASYAKKSMVTAAAVPASAANQAQDGLVNVAVGDVGVLDNANIGVAA